MAQAALPRGIRNHNPGNIEWGDPWQGLRPAADRTDKRFAQFVSAAYGLRALARVLISYYDNHGIRTVRAAISRWAPPVENNTESYVLAVAAKVGVAPDEPIDFHDYERLRPLLEGIVRHENGAGPRRTANSWYTAAEVDEGLRLAGVRPAPSTRPVPLTTETAGASAAGAVGLGTLLDLAPAIGAALSSVEEHLTSGQWVRIALGAVSLAAAIAVAYAQVQRHKRGVL